MLVGILLGNFVPSTGPALQRGKFVGVSVPIGELREEPQGLEALLPHVREQKQEGCLTNVEKWLLFGHSCRLVGHDVSDTVQSTV